MGVLILRFRGVNAYVPSEDKSAMLVVMPNATRLGTSPSSARDSTPLPRHLPMLWNEPVSANPRVLTLTEPVAFPGARLSFTLTGSPGALDLSGISHVTSNAWLEVDPLALSTTPGDSVAGQVLITHGTVTEHVPAKCNKAWPGTSFNSLSLVPVVPGIDVRIENVDSVEVIAMKWVDGGQTTELYPHRDLEADEEVNLFIGNVCAEDVLQWPRNSDGGRVQDDDFKWIFEVAQAQIASLPGAGSPLPAPVVDGSPIHITDSPADAFLAAWGGGGGAGCECNGCGGKPKPFTAARQVK